MSTNTSVPAWLLSPEEEALQRILETTELGSTDLDLSGLGLTTFPENISHIIDTTNVLPKQLLIFLCHASQDKPVVYDLYTALEAHNWIDPWLDKNKILPGQDWEIVIEEAVENSDVVIIYISNQSISKEGFVQREIRYAYDMALEKPEEKIFLIPLRFEDCDVPRKLKPKQWVDYFGTQKQASFSNLMNASELRYNQKIRLEEELSRNEIKSDIVKLTKLDLSNNQLISVPAEIGELINLTSLNLSFNQLKSLPAEFQNLNNLKELREDLRGSVGFDSGQFTIE
jgi:Leucine-rich repeat (LRR) protein